MEESSKDKIDRLRKEYEVAKQACGFKGILHDKREVIDNSIHELENDLEKETFKLHRKQKEDGDVEHQGKRIQKNRELLSRVKETRKKLDEQLDDYEYFSEEMLLGLRDELIKAILLAHPGQSRKYEELDTALSQSSWLLSQTKDIQSAISEIGKLLDVIDIERKRVKRGWILGYLFGRNPNFTITVSLKAIGQLAEDTLSALKELDVSPVPSQGLASIFINCAALLKELKEHAPSRWGWRKIDYDILPYLHEIHSLDASFVPHIAQLETEAGELKRQIEEWIEKEAR